MKRTLALLGLAPLLCACGRDAGTVPMDPMPTVLGEPRPVPLDAGLPASPPPSAQAPAAPVDRPAMGAEPLRLDAPDSSDDGHSR